MRVSRGLLVVATVLTVVGVGGCGSLTASDRSEVRTPGPTSTSSAAQRHAAEAATAVLRKHGALVAGTIGPPAAFGDADCNPTDDGAGRIVCAFGTTYFGNMEPTWFEVRIQPDGSLSKVLGRREPVAGSKSSAQTAALLASDDLLQHAPSRTRDYACRRAHRIEPDGARGSTSAAGQLCATYLRVSRENVERYVEFAPDGTVTRDYVIRATSSDAGAARVAG